MSSSTFGGAGAGAGSTSGSIPAVFERVSVEQSLFTLLSERMEQTYQTWLACCKRSRSSSWGSDGVPDDEYVEHYCTEECWEREYFDVLRKRFPYEGYTFSFKIDGTVVLQVPVIDVSHHFGFHDSLKRFPKMALATMLPESADLKSRVTALKEAAHASGVSRLVDHLEKILDNTRKLEELTYVYVTDIKYSIVSDGATHPFVFVFTKA
jgi:hypothetical protein